MHRRGGQLSCITLASQQHSSMRDFVAQLTPTTIFCTTTQNTQLAAYHLATEYKSNCVVAEHNVALHNTAQCKDAEYHMQHFATIEHCYSSSTLLSSSKHSVAAALHSVVDAVHSVCTNLQMFMQ